MIAGSCYCGAVTYEVPGRLVKFLNCHCGDCRKISGATFAPVLVAMDKGFRVVTGEDHLVRYASSPGKQRCFCKTCGTHLYATSEKLPRMVLLRAGTLDSDPGMKPDAHIWTQAKAPWHEILDEMPQFPEGLPRK